MTTLTQAEFQAKVVSFSDGKEVRFHPHCQAATIVLNDNAELMIGYLDGEWIQSLKVKA